MSKITSSNVPSAATAGSVVLTNRERREIEEILKRRANEIASFKTDLQDKLMHETGKPIRLHDLPGSVELAITREIERLRKLAAAVALPEQQESDDE